MYRTESLRVDAIDCDDDGPDIAAPSFKDMFTAALLTTPVEQAEPKQQPFEQKAQKGGKKKKNKGTLLFATGAQRKY